MVFKIQIPKMAKERNILCQLHSREK